MARHYAPTKKKKLKLPTLPKLPKLPKLSSLPSFPPLRVPALPNFFQREKRSYAPRQFDRVFSVGDMLLLMAATLLFIAGLLLPLSPWTTMLLYAFSTLLAAVPLFLQLLQ